MGTNVIVVTVDGNQYKIEKNGISDFALIGVLECILADLKSVSRKREAVGPAPKEIEKEGKPDSFKGDPLMEKEVERGGTEVAVSEQETEVPKPIETKPVTPPVSTASDIKSRIINARQAIRDLQGQVDDLDMNKMTDEELQGEFEELTAQYKRLKSSQTIKKR